MGYTPAERRDVVRQVLERLELLGPQSLGDLFHAFGGGLSEYRILQALRQLKDAGDVATESTQRYFPAWGRCEATTTVRLYFVRPTVPAAKPPAKRKAAKR